MRTKEEAIIEQTNLKKVCSEATCPFRKEIHDAILAVSQKPQLVFGNTQKPEITFGESQKPEICFGEPVIPTFTFGF